jgi:hypothetical protein
MAHGTGGAYAAGRPRIGETPWLSVALKFLCWLPVFY